jgi:hypothetical protein
VTAAAVTVSNIDGLEGIPARAKMRHVLRVAPSGEVLVVSTWTWRLQGKGAPLKIAARPSATLVLGWVPPDRTDAWQAAERLAAVNGWRPAGEWTTVGRLPTVLVERAG